MIDKSQNKMQTRDGAKENVGADLATGKDETPYYFPEHGISIVASSQAEALEKLGSLINKS
jgi:hypothetical protein